MAYIYQSGRDALKRSIANYAPMLSGRVLDVGAGSFDRYSRLFKSSSEYLRLDVDGVMNVDMHGTAEHLPVEDGTFGGIVCTQVLCDVFEIHKAFAEFNRVLIPGGRVLSTTPFVGGLANEKGSDHFFWNISPFALRRLYEGHGFKVLILERTCGSRETVFNLKTRFLIDHWQLYDRWYGRLFSYWFKVRTNWVRYRDRRDGNTYSQSRMGSDFIVVAEKL